MNEQLRQQLKHPQARQRHEAIVQLARLKDEDVVPLLNDISKNDPEPKLRQLAERAVIHILNEFSSTISRVQAVEPPLSKVPPYSNLEAEKYIQKAFELYASESSANALYYLIKALDLTPMLVDDFDVQLLAENLTGIEGTIAAKILTDRDKRNQFFDDDLRYSSGNLPIKPSSFIVFLLFLVVMSQFFLADGVEMINIALDELSMQQIKQSAQRVNGADYYVLTPDTIAMDDGYPLLVAIPDGKENSSAMLHHFAEFANTYGAILLIPEFTDYRFTQIEHHTTALQAMIAEISRSHKLDEAGVVLFGFEDGATIATQYANRYPDQTAYVITSGGTFLYPPSGDVSYTVVYGADDELLQGLTDSYAPFADLTEWKTPLNYLMIEHTGHEINSQQIDITKQILLDVYQ